MFCGNLQVFEHLWGTCFSQSRGCAHTGLWWCSLSLNEGLLEVCLVTWLCPKCGWSALTLGPDEAKGTLVAWSGIVSALILKQHDGIWDHLGGRGRMVLWKSAGLGRKVPVWVFFSVKLRGSSNFCSLPFLLLWHDTHRSVQTVTKWAWRVLIGGLSCLSSLLPPLTKSRENS